jgi:hypothetical protein
MHSPASSTGASSTTACGALSAQRGGSYALLYIDLDQFGSSTTPAATRQAIGRAFTGLLQTRVRSSDTISALRG